MKLAVLDDPNINFFDAVDGYIYNKDLKGLETFLGGNKKFLNYSDDKCMINLFEYASWPGNDGIKIVLENELKKVLENKASGWLLKRILRLAIAIDSPELIKKVLDNSGFQGNKRSLAFMFTIALEKRRGLLKKESIKMLLKYGAAGLYSIGMYEMIENNNFVHMKTYDPGVDEIISPLTFAAATDNYTAIQGMLDQGYNLKSFDSMYRTVLGWAAFNDNVKCVKTLIDNSAPPNNTDMYHYTPMDLAYLTRSREVAMDILQTGGNFLIRELAEAVLHERKEQQKKLLSVLSETIKINTQTFDILKEAGGYFYSVMEKTDQKNSTNGITENDITIAILNSNSVEGSLETISEGKGFSVFNF
jgi:hypothetical protein